LQATDILHRIDAIMLYPAEHGPGVEDRPTDGLWLVTTDGQVFAGEAAFRWLAWRLPVLWPIALLFPLPGVTAAARQLYRRALQRGDLATGIPAAAAQIAREQSRS